MKARYQLKQKNKYYYTVSTDISEDKAEILANLSVHFLEETLNDKFKTVAVHIPFSDYTTYSAPNIPKFFEMMSTGDIKVELTEEQFKSYCERVEAGESIFTLNLDN